ncbi:MAG: DUF4271 domain-containing protein [Arcicella sp.]|nr:DUF4271 domain-containing protein [Arcicella sp.]
MDYASQWTSTTWRTANRLRFIAILLFAYCLSPVALHAKGGIGPESSYYLVHDYQDDWQVFDARYKAYVPYVREQHKDYNSFSLFFDIENYKGYKLLYRSEKENYLFIDATLQKKLSNTAWVVLDIDSLQRAFGKTKLFLTIYGTNSNVEDITIQIGNKISKTQKTTEIGDSLLTILPRNLSPFQNFFVIGLLLLACLYAFLYNFQPKSFQRFFSVRDLLTLSKRDESFVVNKPFDIGNVLFVVNLSFTLSFIFMLITHEKTDLFSASNILREGETLGTLLWNFLEIAVITFVAINFKYFSLRTLSNLYRLDNITNIHYFKIIQASSIFFLLILVVLTFSTVSNPEIIKSAEKYFFVPISLFFVLRLVLLYFTINKMATLKNLYLFSYLCIIELIPLIVGIRFAL